MPADEYNRFRDEEIGRLIAYVRSVPPVDTGTPPHSIYPLARALHTLGAPTVAAEQIDHTRRNDSPPPGATIEDDRFIGRACQFCHAETLAGQEVGGEEGAPPSPPIGPSGTPSRWTDAPFMQAMQAMQTGVTPEGRQLRNQYMPWQAIGQLSDDELRAILLRYLKNGA